ncbi:MAG: hypothetical protein M3392_06615 [Actinomycetota bacterium]|nr:hypothetical protein [Actinomycetota bacterium]
MREESRESLAKDHSQLQRAVGVVKVLFWACAALMTVLVVLSWVAPGVREALSFNLLGGTCAGLAMISSAFLFWQELRANRQQLRDVRRESRDISVEEGNEWTPKAWLYATAFGISFLLSWYLLPALFFSF